MMVNAVYIEEKSNRLVTHVWKPYSDISKVWKIMNRDLDLGTKFSKFAAAGAASTWFRNHPGR